MCRLVTFRFDDIALMIQTTKGACWQKSVAFDTRPAKQLYTLRVRMCTFCFPAVLCSSRLCQRGPQQDKSLEKIDQKQDALLAAWLTLSLDDFEVARATNRAGCVCTHACDRHGYVSEPSL